jgi:hypothetical protein
VGTLHPRGTMFLRIFVGTAKEGREEYEMSLAAGGESPLITSKRTGKIFSLSWEQMLELARRAGIDERD